MAIIIINLNIFSSKELKIFNDYLDCHLISSDWKNNRTGIVRLSIYEFLAITDRFLKDE
jgi:hypothetical protein